jgi:hypothetical protein
MDADEARSGIEAEALGPPGLGDLQAQARLAHDVCKAIGFCCEHTAAERGESVVVAAGILVSRAAAKFLHELALD